MDPREIAWTLGAAEDVTRVLEWIAGQDPAAARRWQSGINTRVERVAEYPNSGRVVPEFARDDVREVIYGNYRVVYQVTSTHVIVIRVLEGHRQMPDTELD